MRPPRLSTARIVLPLLAAICLALPLRSAEIRVIDADNHPDLAGKEIDWIYGDYLLSNDRLTLVVAAPVSTRDANLTVRSIGASILDLSLNEPSNDQLSAFIPGGTRYMFHDKTKAEMGKKGDTVFWRCQSSKSVANDGTSATVTYTLRDGDAFVTAELLIEGEKAEAAKAVDSVRADNTFFFPEWSGVTATSDLFFRQTFGFRCPGSSEAIRFKKGRPAELLYSAEQVKREPGRLSWSVEIHPATSPFDLQQSMTAGENAVMRRFQVDSQLPEFNGESMMRAKVSILPEGSDAKPDPLMMLQTDDAGNAFTRLRDGRYRVSVEAIGFAPRQTTIDVAKGQKLIRIPLETFSGFSAQVRDGEGNRIPAKATIYAADGEHPDFGPNSTRTFVKNCVYSVSGSFRCPLDPGSYEIYFSRGPEYNSAKQALEIKAGETPNLEIQLQRVVDTRGWVSSEMHSHSSPSGDNTSDQYGRVENLLCEHLEFAPCTEHNRISSYAPHLIAMNREDLMATCTGMELTGRPLPANHQNSFPLHHHPHTQNGGGPRVHSNPEVQIERIAMWDNASEKLVQMNHPNLHQIYGDLDVDGKPDKGFRKMLSFMDVIEVHPLETIFEDVAANPPAINKMKIPLFQWMQLLNQGYRIPGVVNTDAHYNHHGSGWLRNWFASSTDDPARISTDEMVKQAEKGHIVMSSGPFLRVSGSSKASDRRAIPGDDLPTRDATVSLKVSVQCPNWMDVNRIQLFVNGRPSEQHNYSRKTHPQAFGDSDAVVKYDGTWEVKLDEDAHLIVATMGEGMTMEKEMGGRYGKRPPIAVSNPIFVDVDGGGFRHNGDELGLPLPRQAAHSH